MNSSTGAVDLPAVRSTALSALRTLDRLETLYRILTSSGLRAALPQPGSIQVGERLVELLEALRTTEQDLDWELTAEIVRLKDVLEECTVDYARAKYGMAKGGQIKIPVAVPGLPELLHIAEIAFVDAPDYELRVTANPVRSDGTVLSERIELLVGPEGVKVRLADGNRRDKLRGQVNR